MLYCNDAELSSHPLCSEQSRRHMILKISLGICLQLHEAQQDRALEPRSSENIKVTKKKQLLSLPTPSIIHNKRFQTQLQELKFDLTWLGHCSFDSSEAEVTSASLGVQVFLSGSSESLSVLLSDF